LLSIGCGNAVLENFLVSKLGINPENIVIADRTKYDHVVEDEIRFYPFDMFGQWPDFGQKFFRQAGGFLTVDHDPAGCRTGHAADNGKQRCFTRSAGALKHGDFFGPDCQLEVFERREFIGLAGVEDFGN